AYRSNDFLRSTLRNDLYVRRRSDRLIEIATEGKGAVINAFVPEDVDESAGDTSAESTASAEVESSIDDQDSSDSSSSDESEDEGSEA
ncbi:MAG: hypothetical protein AB7G88_09350, partial [Thermomicrobiales bacterium]